MTKDLLHSDRTNEGRQHHGNQYQRPQKRLAWKNKPIAEEGERDGDEHGQHGASDSHQERVPEPFEVDRIAENLGRIVERELSIRPDKGPAQSLANRPYKKYRKKHSSDEEHKFGEDVGHELTQRRGGAERKMGFRENCLQFDGVHP